MKLLFITQEFDSKSASLGFTVEWVETARKYYDSVEVFALRGDLTSDQFSAFGKSNKLSTWWELQKLLWKKRKSYDVILCHLSGYFVWASFALAKLLGKKIYLWYAHAHLDVLSKKAPLVLNKVFTASVDSYPSHSKKVVIGHGISEIFFQKNLAFTPQEKNLELVSIGRITPLKNYMPLIEAMKEVVENESRLKLTLYGPLITSADHEYKEYLCKNIKRLGLEEHIFFGGPLNHIQVPSILEEATGFVNLQCKGGIGKAVLESFALGVPAFICTDAYDHELSPETVGVLKFSLAPPTLAKQILKYLSLPQGQKERIQNELKNYVKASHRLQDLWRRIHQEMSQGPAHF